MARDQHYDDRGHGDSVQSDVIARNLVMVQRVVNQSVNQKIISAFPLAQCEFKYSGKAIGYSVFSNSQRAARTLQKTKIDFTNSRYTSYARC